LVADKECQTSLVNYRKGGQAFINLVTVIPIFGGLTDSDEESDQIVYHVGFQVDLTEQPNLILEKLRDGSYYYRTPCETGGPSPYLIGGPPEGRRDGSRRLPGAISQELKAALADPTFIHSIPLSGTTTMVPSPGDKDGNDGNHPLSLILLEVLPDFIHVLSLKGNFLYVAPSVRRVLGYEPDELVGKAIQDFCHPADVVPLMRELKESSTVPTTGSEAATIVHAPKRVDLLYRARNKAGEFVWAEARGRLFVEPGKGRKAIILSGRARLGMEHGGQGWRLGGIGGILGEPLCRRHVPRRHLVRTGCSGMERDGGDGENDGNVLASRRGRSGGRRGGYDGARRQHPRAEEALGEYVAKGW
jgi:PAS domain S-box-containing protein